MSEFHLLRVSTRRKTCFQGDIQKERFRHAHDFYPILRSFLTKSAAVLIGLSTCAVGSALAATPTVYSGNATITGSGDVVTVARIPVQDSSGNIHYYDVTINFGVTAAGALSIASSTIQASANLIISNFQAGTYASPPGNNTWTNRLSGPGVGPAGTTAWSFNASGGTSPNCSVPWSATWYTGPISSNPYTARITAAGITSTDYSYGISGPVSESLCSGPDYFNFNNANGVAALIGCPDCEWSEYC